MAGAVHRAEILRRATRPDEFKVTIATLRKILVLNPIRRSLFL